MRGKGLEVKEKKEGNEWEGSGGQEMGLINEKDEGGAIKKMKEG